MQNKYPKHTYAKNRRIQKDKTMEDYFYFSGIAALGIFAISRVLFSLSPNLRRLFRLPPCLFYLITGYYCPGCGGTRAVRALAGGRFLRAVYYHPFVPFAAVIFLCFMLTQTVERTSRGRLRIGIRCHSGFLWASLAIVIGNFAIKNALHYFYGFVL